MRKSAVHHGNTTGLITMEAERVNLIGNTLSDLAARTRELRGYL
ncbi:hypothetical protein [Xylophilus sp.]|nr:hypothetical protein [Xylophilus sp.]KAF1049468.1 MAG: hypothetical protein GAK38_00560 [Xylophilus sp.]